MILLYDSNNSGGYWWLKDPQWKALEAAGWVVHWGGRDWDKGPLAPGTGDRDRWLGALATSAAKSFPSTREGVDEWERVTGACASDQGCNCCGPPHSFEVYTDDGERDYDADPVLVLPESGHMEYPE